MKKISKIKEWGVKKSVDKRPVFGECPAQKKRPSLAGGGGGEICA